MKLHRNVLLTLATCAAASLAAAEDVTWTNEAFDYTTSSPTFPTDGKIIKTGDGTVTLSLSDFYASDNAAVTATASDYTGDIDIQGGSIKLGINGTGGKEQNFQISPDALGTAGTISISTGAKLELQITQKGTATIGKDITLNDGTVSNLDGNYELGLLTVNGSGTIHNEWGKEHHLQRHQCRGCHSQRNRQKRG